MIRFKYRTSEARSGRGEVRKVKSPTLARCEFECEGTLLPVFCWLAQRPAVLYPDCTSRGMLRKTVADAKKDLRAESSVARAL